MFSQITVLMLLIKYQLKRQHEKETHHTSDPGPSNLNRKGVLLSLRESFQLSSRGIHSPNYSFTLDLSKIDETNIT